MSFKLPMTTDWMRKNMEHEPSRTYAEDIYKLAGTYHFKDALEIGCAWGFSTLSILLGNPNCKLLSVDPNPKTNAPTEVIANKLVDRWSFYEGRSEDFWEENTQKFDFIYIDGSHLYDDVRNDLYKAWQVLNPRGVILIDDWDHKKNINVEGNTTEYGVSLACWEFWRDHLETVKKASMNGRILYFEHV